LWDVLDGNVVLQTVVVFDEIAVNLFETSKAVLGFRPIA
jgi:hypothetical protein